MAPAQNNETKQMTLGEHIRELKARIKVALLTIVVLFVIFYLRADKVLSLILTIGEDMGYKFFYITPYEMLLESLKCAFVLAVCCSAPVMIYELFAFVSPAVEEVCIKRKLVIVMLLSGILFVLGVLFCVKILFPFILKYLRSYSEQFGVMECVSVNSYVSMCMSLSLLIGIVFEVPIVTGFLGKLGMISSRMMMRGIRPAVIVILVISAIITPPDVLSMLFVAVPITVIYGVGILICKLFEPKRGGGSYESGKQ